MVSTIHYIYISFILIGCGTLNAVGQTSSSVSSSEFSAISDTVDSVSYIPQKSLEYIYPDPNRVNKLAENLRRELIVTNGDFITWLNFSGKRYEKTHMDVSIPSIKTSRPTWILIVTGILFLSISLVRVVFLIDFKYLARALYDSRALEHFVKEGNITTAWAYIFLFWISCFSLGLFLTIIFGLGGLAELSVFTFLKTSILIIAVLTAKLLLIRFVSMVFDLGNFIAEYITVLYILYFNIGVVLIPFLLAVTLLPFKYFSLIIALFTVLVVLLLIYTLFKTALHLFKLVRFSIFYLIIYLCTFEIAPFLILVKVL